LIIGSGAAGSAAAESLRRYGFAGRIIMLSRDPVEPYDRTACSKAYLAGDANEESVALRSADFYRRLGIEIQQRHVVQLDYTLRELTFADGHRMTGDAILLATGARPRRLDVPGSTLEGVTTLRSLGDAGAIRELAKSAPHIVIVGGGFIAMEAAASLADDDRTVTVVLREPVPFEGHFGRQVGEAFQHFHEKHGTRFQCGANVVRFGGQHRVEEVVLDNGTTLPAELVVVAVGVRPATNLVHGIPRNDDGSVNVNDEMRIADHVYAAGDVARFHEPSTDRWIRVEHWRTAQQMGQAAGQSMAGKPAPFRCAPFFWTRQFGTSFQYAGYAESWDEVVVAGDLEGLDFTAYYLEGDRVLATLGTRKEQTAALIHRLRDGEVPSADEVRKHGQLELPVSDTVSSCAGGPTAD
jgi:NADPH-dependent 2,4-dienoyl-CoA reductase/sulfur reductase-like enzyme